MTKISCSSTLKYKKAAMALIAITNFIGFPLKLKKKPLLQNAHYDVDIRHMNLIQLRTFHLRVLEVGK